MKKNYILTAAAVLLISLFILGKYVFLQRDFPIPANNMPSNSTTFPIESKNSSESAALVPAPLENQVMPSSGQNSSEFQPPLNRATERVTKKPFGIFITPQNSPVKPERFRGFHTGTDFEIFPEEINADVGVNAICEGLIARKNSASGYGGMLVQSCTFDNQPITVVYGHLELASIPKSAGEKLSAGEKIGILGKAYSSETDGERKHLHLGIHRGSEINIRGYVSTQAELSGWIDPCLYVCR
jgi:hypothetical protein